MEKGTATAPLNNAFFCTAISSAAPRHCIHLFLAFTIVTVLIALLQCAFPPASAFTESANYDVRGGEQGLARWR